MHIDEKLISRLENLARLELSSEERGKIQYDMNEILKMVGKLDELDTDNVEPLIYINDEVNSLRADEVKNQVTNKEALRNAPQKNDQHFKVPKVINL